MPCQMSLNQEEWGAGLEQSGRVGFAPLAV